MNFKIETKPTFWHIRLSHGAYSDYDESHYFIRANDRDEAWYLFKDYWQQNFKEESPYYPCLLLNDDESKTIDQFIPDRWSSNTFGGIDDEPRMESAYGDAQDCHISQLKVIEAGR